MNVPVLIIRTAHILLGTFWVGAIFLVAFFVGPAVSDAGPDGAKVMAALVKRRLLNVVPAFATITILTGFWLFSRDSAGFQGDFMSSRMGMSLGTGGLLALVGYVIGLTVMRPSTLKAMALGQSAAQLPEAERGAVMARIQQLRGRAAMAGRTVAVLLMFAVVAMAVARYL